MDSEKTFSEKTQELIQICEWQIDYLKNFIVIQNENLQYFIENNIEENTINNKNIIDNS